MDCIYTVGYLEREWNYIHITFDIVYAYTYPTLLLVIVFNILLCLIYKLNFITVVFVYEKKNIYRNWYCPWFQLSTRGLATYPCR